MCEGGVFKLEARWPGVLLQATCFSEVALLRVFCTFLGERRYTGPQD